MKNSFPVLLLLCGFLAFFSSISHHPSLSCFSLLCILKFVGVFVFSLFVRFTKKNRWMDLEFETAGSDRQKLPSYGAHPSLSPFLLLPMLGRKEHGTICVDSTPSTYLV